MSFVQPATDRNARSIRILIGLTVFASAMRSLTIFWFHPLNWDEIEFFRATDWIARGLVPYRDFWEHHTPLMWFLFAPLASLTHSPGAAAIMLMRWGQVPFWIATFWLTMRWMQNAGIGRFGQWAAVTATACSAFFMMPAVEYRVDTLACLLYMAGLVLLQRMRESARAAFWAGVVFCLVGMANLRMGPLLAITVLLARITDTGEKRWKGTSRANWIFAGVIAALAAWLAYFLATGSAGDFLRRVFYENYLGDKFGIPILAAFLHRLLIPFGIRVYGSAEAFDPIGIDIGGAFLVAVGLIGVVRAILRWRAPDDLFFLSFLQLTSLMFIAAMNFIYNYHFEVVAIMMIPFVAVEVDRFVLDDSRRRRIVITILVFAAISTAFLVLFRGKEQDLQYQDFVMHEIERRTKPGDKVFDGAGWALDRTPAYEYWFIPDMIRQLEPRGLIAPYRTPQVIADPPALVVADFNVLLWMRLHPDLRLFMIRHYLPVWRSLWIPGLSARLTPQHPAAGWIAPADGNYRAFGSARLAKHPWFRDPLLYGTFYDASPRILRLDLRNDAAGRSPDLHWFVDGRPAAPADNAFHLRKGQKFAVIYTGPQPVGLMLVPGDDRLLFQQPGSGITIEAAMARETHVPDFRQLIRWTFR